MHFGKIAGICLISVGIALLAVQARRSMSMQADHARQKVERELKNSPYAGIFGMAFVVGGAGFVFAARKRMGSRSLG